MMQAGSPSWAHKVSPERVAAWQAAVIDGRRKLADMERRATYPANPDQDTVALCEHFRLQYKQGRILKALSFSYAISADALCDLTGVHPALIKMEVHHTSRRVGMQIFVVSGPGRSPVLFKIINESDCKRIRDVIARSWSEHLSLNCTG